MNLASLIELAVVLSVVLAFLGIILIIIDIMKNHVSDERGKEERRTGVGGVVLIGPIPIIFGNDKSVIKWAIILTIIIVILFVVLTLLPGILLR